uniref:Uncharacterized protein n=1 Tax=Brassica oleracea var. oleracea TaxID=109376 RepID=A0A0D3DEX1_BRAOL
MGKPVHFDAIWEVDIYKHEPWDLAGNEALLLCVLENDRCSLCFSCLVISRVGVVICSEIMVSTIFF